MLKNIIRNRINTNYSQDNEHMSENFEKLKMLIHQTVIERLNDIKRQKQIRKIMNSKINKRLSESKVRSHISDKILKRLDSFK